MKSKKLLERLADWMDKDNKKPQDQREKLEYLLKKLKKKETKLKEKLKREDNKLKHKQLKLELKVVKTQRAKGEAVLRNLKGS